MLLCQASLSVLGAVLGVLVPAGCCGSPSHSLRYFYLLLLEPSQGLPRFSIRGHLDDQPITHYDSLTGRMEPLVPWMEEAEKETYLARGWVFGTALENLSKRNQPTEGLDTWQVILGCELWEDGNKDGVFRYGYNGMDFLSFEKETLTWVAAQPQAEKVKETWEEDLRWSQRNKIYLEETCIEWLKIYQSYREEALERTKPPVGKVIHKVVDDSLEVLTCQAFGFYPKEIQATWTRDGENWEQETFRRTVVLNSDGTYYVWISIEIDPKERDRFRCHLEHDGLLEPLILAFKEERGWWIPVGFVTATILGAGILFLICRWWRWRKDLPQEVTTYPDPGFPERLISSYVRDKIESEQEMLRAGLGSQWAPDAAVPTLRKREKRLHRDILPRTEAEQTFLQAMAKERQPDSRRGSF